MNIHSLKHATHLLVLAVALAVPLAFAQTDTTPTPPAPASAPMQTGAMASDAMAQSSTPKTWKELDANKDGKLSKDEVAGDPTWSAEFDAADSNKDGFVSKTEFKQHNDAMKKK